MKSHIVYQYFKKEIEGKTIYMQVDPIGLKGSQLIVPKNGEPEFEEVEFESEVIEALVADGFSSANALAFHIILNGLA